LVRIGSKAETHFAFGDALALLGEASVAQAIALGGRQLPIIGMGERGGQLSPRSR